MIIAQSLFPLLAQTRLADKARLKKRIQGVQKIRSEEKQQSVLTRIKEDIQSSIDEKQRKQANLPKVTYVDGLPVSEHVDQISKAIQENQVVIIAGETGSGKTTQIPKICLDLGRGVEGMIGHTQPRRIAASYSSKPYCRRASIVFGTNCWLQSPI